MPDAQKAKWSNALPNLNDTELQRFEDIMTNEVRGLADIYLKVLQRRNEGRSFNSATDISDQPIVSARPSSQNISSETQKTDVEDNNLPSRLAKSLEDDKGDREREQRILERLVNGSNSIEESQKAAMIEVSKFMPSHVLRDLQDVVIRQGLRALRDGSSLTNNTNDTNDTNDTDTEGVSNPNLSNSNIKIIVRGKMNKLVPSGKYVLVSESKKRYIIRNDSMSLDKSLGKTIEVEGIKDPYSKNVILADKIRLLVDL